MRRDGQTLGKGLMGLRVVSTREGPLQLGPAFIRLLMLFLPFVLFSVAGRDAAANAWDSLAYIGIVVILASLVMAALRRNHRRAVHDLLAYSRVVMAPKRGVNLRKDLPMMVPRKVNMVKSL